MVSDDSIGSSSQKDRDIVGRIFVEDLFRRNVNSPALESDCIAGKFVNIEDYVIGVLNERVDYVGIDPSSLLEGRFILLNGGAFEVFVRVAHFAQMP